MKNVYQFPDHTIIQDIQPQCDELHIRIKDAKEMQRKTNQRIADETGVPLSNIAKFFTGVLANPNVFNVSAICICLGLSLDKLMGIPTDVATEDAASRISELELMVNNYEKDLEYARNDRKHLADALKARKPVIYILLAMCTLLIATFGTYLILDLLRPGIGIFQSTHTTVLAVVFIVSVVVAFAAIIAIMGHRIYIDRKNGKKKDDTK